MNYDKFETIVHCLQKTVEYTNRANRFVRPEIFDTHNRLIALLLESIYDADAVAYVLFEWMNGNTSPLSMKQEDGSELILPLETLHDVWVAMEKFPVNSMNTELEIKEDVSVDNQN